MKYVYRIWCEWDIGQDYEVYASQEAADKSIQSNEVIKDILKDEGLTLQDLFDEGLIGVNGVRVVE